MVRNHHVSAEELEYLTPEHGIWTPSSVNNTIELVSHNQAMYTKFGPIVYISSTLTINFGTGAVGEAHPSIIGFPYELLTVDPGTGRAVTSSWIIPWISRSSTTAELLDSLGQMSITRQSGTDRNVGIGISKSATSTSFPDILTRFTGIYPTRD